MYDVCRVSPRSNVTHGTSWGRASVGHTSIRVPFCYFSDYQYNTAVNIHVGETRITVIDCPTLIWFEESQQVLRVDSQLGWTVVVVTLSLRSCVFALQQETSQRNNDGGGLSARSQTLNQTSWGTDWHKMAVVLLVINKNSDNCRIEQTSLELRPQRKSRTAPSRGLTTAESSLPCSWSTRRKHIIWSTSTVSYKKSQCVGYDFFRKNTEKSPRTDWIWF